MYNSYKKYTYWSLIQYIWVILFGTATTEEQNSENT